jgi:hypothetical protein
MSLEELKQTLDWIHSVSISLTKIFRCSQKIGRIKQLSVEVNESKANDLILKLDLIKASLQTEHDPSSHPNHPTKENQRTKLITTSNILTTMTLLPTVYLFVIWRYYGYIQEKLDLYKLKIQVSII